jgi:P4 family phage/plasmid primase-like protien
MSLENYLKEKRSEQKYTHVSIQLPKGKFNIENKDEFWNLYYQNDITRCIGEVSNIAKILPILVDFDIKDSIENHKNNQFLNSYRVLYNLENVKKIVKIYQNVLRNILINIKEEHLYCLLLEKKCYQVSSHEDIIIKNGFHLHFPFIFINKLNHELDLLPRIRLELKQILDEMSNIPNIENCIDKGYLKAPWLLYGCAKDTSMEPYQITMAFDYDVKEITDWKSIFENYKLYNDNNELLEIDMNKFDYYLPQILSIQLNNRFEYLYDVKDNLPNLNASKLNSIVKMKKIIYNEDVKNNSSLIENLLNCLSQNRSDDHNEWLYIGWILYNIFNGSEDGLHLWLEFSKKSKKYDERVCIYEWQKMTNQNVLSIGTLKYFAKQDNPDLYSKIVKEYSEHLYDRNIKLNGNHNDLAYILFHKYECEFMCGSIKHNIWYHFKNHTWHKDEEGVTLRKKISEEMVKEFEKIADQLWNQLKQDEDTNIIQKKINTIMKIISSLKSAPFKSNIMKECNEIFYNSEILTKLDSEAYFIGFKNGIYDLKNHIFRDGKPNDYVSLKMPIEYKEFDIDSEEIKEIENYFMKIFPDNEVREYFLNSASEIFIGGNFNKIVQIWTGEGDNGKSITQSLFETMLGPYNVKLPTSLITGKRSQSSSACPELVRAGNGVRLAMLQEPDKKDTINIGILKELSGNDSFFARGLYKEGQEINPMFKLIVVCNEPPAITYSDKATWNRIILIPFESTFTDEAPSSFEEQLQLKKFPKDPKFKDKIPKMIEPLAFFLLHRLKTKPTITKLPLKVKIATENYKQKNDVFKQYMNEWIEFKEGKFCNHQEMYQSFRDWFRESFPDSSCPDRNEFTSYFTKIWGPMYNKEGWKDRFIRGIMDYA